MTRGAAGEGRVAPDDYEYAIDSVENAAKTLLMLRDRTSIRAVDVAAELGTARSTAHRMVLTLAKAGLLRRNERDKSYVAGYALVELGLAVIGAADIRDAIAPLLRRVAEDTEETVHLLVRQHDEVLFVAVAEGTHVIRAVPRVGARLPAHVTSAGKCLLAELTEEELVALYPDGWSGGEGTDAAVRDRHRLLAELREVRDRGWAVNRAESEPGLFAVSAVVRDGRGNALGALSVSGPSERLEPRVEAIAGVLVGAASDFAYDRPDRT